MKSFAAVGAGILYWESVRESAAGKGDYSLGRMADELAEAYRSSCSRHAAEGDRRCPERGDRVGHPAG